MAGDVIKTLLSTHRLLGSRSLLIALASATALRPLMLLVVGCSMIGWLVIARVVDPVLSAVGERWAGAIRQARDATE